MAYTITDFHKEYEEIIKTVPTYRAGQHFINEFIKESSSDEMCDLWNDCNYITALSKIYSIIDTYGWDYYDLPVISKEKQHEQI